MFTNLSLNDRMTHEEMSVVLQESFEIVYGVCSPLNGCLNKIFAFDKDAKVHQHFGQCCCLLCDVDNVYCFFYYKYRFAKVEICQQTEQNYA
jgi:hypothetical protein